LDNFLGIAEDPRYNQTSWFTTNIYDLQVSNGVQSILESSPDFTNFVSPSTKGQDWDVFIY